MSDLAALLARIEAATGDEESLFVDAARSLLLKPPSGDIEAQREHDLWWFRYGKMLDSRAFESAAVALCERVLPGYCWGVNSKDPLVNNLSVVELWRASDNKGCVYSEAFTPALALCAAVVKAKMEERKP